MLKQFMLGGVALAIVSGVAFAENSAANPPPAQPDAQAADSAGNPPPPQDGDGQGWWGWGKHRHGGRHGEFGQGRMASDGVHLRDFRRDASARGVFVALRRPGETRAQRMAPA